VLSTPIRPQGLTTDAQVSTFSKAVEEHPPGPEALALARHAYEQSLLLELFNFETFHRFLVRIIKRTKEHARALPETPQSWFLDLGRDTREPISGVGEKFQIQIRRLTDDPSVAVENHEILQERVRKGCAYFTDKITTLLLEPLQAMVVASDNQAARKAVEEAIDQLIRQVQIKLACLKACAQGFSIQTYLTVRAQASVDMHAAKSRRRARDQKPAVDVVHPDLYQRLKTWRQAKADEKDVSPNTLITLKTMISVANALPQSRMQLKKVRGIGKKTLANIGDELLVQVRDYVNSHKEAAVEVSESSNTPDDADDTRQASLDLFRKGKSIADIAKHRGFVASTIETHLAHSVKSGQLPLAEIMPLEKAQPAMDFLRAEQMLALSPAKEKFGDQYTYGELRMILHHLIYTGVIGDPR
ncbi:MAG: helix-turn-helix domain-containing protein, partial [Phycisphaeraceae bacterium]|nr:helix-turn-helix domain-containing protein [Phycisphaeraceae bacterium]